MLSPMTYTVTDKLRLDQGPVWLADLDPGDTSLFDGSKQEAKKALADLGEELRPAGADVRRRLHRRVPPGARRAAGHGHLRQGRGHPARARAAEPQRDQADVVPEAHKEELAQDFLWRIERALPDAGMVGVFDRSHYEDVLVAKMHEIADEGEIEDTGPSTTSSGGWWTPAPSS